MNVHCLRFIADCIIVLCSFFVNYARWARNFALNLLKYCSEKKWLNKVLFHICEFSVQASWLAAFVLWAELSFWLYQFQSWWIVLLVTTKTACGEMKWHKRKGNGQWLRQGFLYIWIPQSQKLAIFRIYSCAGRNGTLTK